MGVVFMSGKFTERAQKVLALAQEEARNLKHPAVGTEHLLLGILREGEGVGARALKNLGINLDQMRQEVVKLIGQGQQPVTGEITLTPRAKKVLELANDEGRRQGVNYIGTEHILLGILREGEGVAARVLVNLGVSADKVRHQVMMLLGGPMGGLAMMLGGLGGTPQWFGQAPPGSMAGGRTATRSATPALDEFSRDLTQLAREDKLDPVIGRDKEIERVIQVLSRRTKNNPVLIGEPGVGKTAVAEGLAQRIVANKVPETLSNRRVIALDLSGIVAGTKYRGEFEERLKRVLNEIRTAGNIVVFIDELHTLIGAGAAEGAIDAANILKPALARGELQCVGATTLDEYRKHIEKDAALERRFQPIMVGEPTVEETIAILRGLRDRYEAHHGVKITDAALEAAANLSHRYISDRFLPDKAIDLIDEAASRVRLRAYTAPPDLKGLEARLEELQKEKEAAVHGQEFEKAAALRDQERRLREELEAKKAEWEKENGLDQSVVTDEDIADIVASWTGIPVRKLAQEESERLAHLEDILHARVIGQNEGVRAIARAIRRARAGLKDPKRPVGSFIFLGPTGVGKTELARALADALFGDEEALVRLDMSEYMEKHTVSRLIGAPPGYVGYEEAGQLTEAVRRRPYTVVLFDEIEKAHPDVFNILLQIMDDGRLTDAKGRTVDFRNTVIIMTSNVGANFLRREAAVGFTQATAEKSYEAMKNRIMDEVRHTFRPEFLNRVDEIIVFHALDISHIKSIVDLMLKQMSERIKDQRLELQVTDAAKEVLARQGFDENFGARPLRRAIQHLVEDQLSEGLIEGKFREGDKILVDASPEGEICLEKISGEPAAVGSGS